MKRRYVPIEIFQDPDAEPLLTAVYFANEVDRMIADKDARIAELEEAVRQLSIINACDVSKLVIDVSADSAGTDNG